MSVPEGLHSNAYYEGLRELRETALVESHDFGERRELGGFVYGEAQATWRQEDGGLAWLIESGLRYHHTTLTRNLPTTLHLWEHVGEPGNMLMT